MKKYSHATTSVQAKSIQTIQFDMETLIGYILLGGTLLSFALIVTGLVWRWAMGHLTIPYSIAGMNLFSFILSDLMHVISGDFRPRLFINSGIAVLILTPYLRVLASMLYFAAVERNLKYSLFTGFVFSVLTYSLFLH
jgi:uncharacterized membrane protein